MFISTKFTLLAILVSVVAAGPTAQTGDPIQPVGAQTLCFTAEGNTNGSPVQLEECDGSAAQEWFFNAPTNAFTIFGGSKCLDVVGGSTDDGAKLQIEDCTGQPNQSFGVVKPSVNGQSVQGSWIINQQTDSKCLDVTGRNFAPGIPIQLNDCAIVADELFQQLPVFD